MDRAWNAAAALNNSPVLAPLFAALLAYALCKGGNPIVGLGAVGGVGALGYELYKWAADLSQRGLDYVTNLADDAINFLTNLANGISPQLGAMLGGIWGRIKGALAALRASLGGLFPLLLLAVAYYLFTRFFLR